MHIQKKNQKCGQTINIRALHVHVKKKAGTIKTSSRQWLKRHLNDPYVQQAKIDGYRSRAAYKLIEIDKQYRFLKKGQKVIDLGAAPGGWSQVCVQRVGSKSDNPTVIGLDYLPIDHLPGTHMLTMNFLEEVATQRLLEALQAKPDLILSDMAVSTTGHRQTDHLRTINLCEITANFAVSILKSGGHFLTKTFQGGADNTLLSMLKKNFCKVHHVKPPSSRVESVELYLLARYFKG